MTTEQKAATVARGIKELEPGLLTEVVEVSHRGGTTWVARVRSLEAEPITMQQIVTLYQVISSQDMEAVAYAEAERVVIEAR